MTTGDPTRSELDPEDRYELLADAERRQVLLALVEMDRNWMSVEDLARAALPDSERAVQRLHHEHVPVLAEHGLVEYDDRTRTVRYYPDDPIESIVTTFNADSGPEPLRRRDRER